MDDLVKMMEETGLPFAYDHFEEGEAADPPFVCYLLPQSNHFSADGKVYLKITEVHIELYTDCKDLSAEQKVEAVLDKQSSSSWCRREAATTRLVRRRQPTTAATCLRWPPGSPQIRHSL